MMCVRDVLTGVVVLASIGFLPAPAVQVAAPSAVQAAPADPYTALFIDGGPKSWRHFGSVVYDSTSGATFTANSAADRRERSEVRRTTSSPGSGIPGAAGV